MRIAGITNMVHVILLWGTITWSTKDTDALQLTTGWKRLSEGEQEPASPGPRSGSSVWTDKHGMAWLFGGRGRSSASSHLGTNNTVTRLRADLWTYEIKAGRWILKVADQAATNDTSDDLEAASAVTIGRELSAMCGIISGNLVIFGGRLMSSEVESGGDDMTATSLRATDQMLIWNSKLLPVQFETRVCGTTEGERSCPSARYDSLFWCDEGFMSIVGGMDTNGRRLIDAWKLDLKRLTWTRLATPATLCSWTTADNVTVQNVNVVYAKNDTNRTDAMYLEPEYEGDLRKQMGVEVEPLALVWSSPISGIYVLCEHMQVVESDDVVELSNIQLWHRDHGAISIDDDTWTIVGESGSRRDLTTWPGVHLHGDTCSDATSGNLWLFGGQSRIGGRVFLNNDVWMYNVSAAVWVKPEIPDASEEPAQRHRAAEFCHRDSMFIYGGSAACDHDNGVTGDCILDDLWVLDTTGSRQALTSNAVRQVHEIITRNMPSLMSSDGSSEGEPYSSAAIFFAISLSMFTIFGVVLFFRRCVSCPPRDGILLKEPPPVRYTVIPDDTSYTI